MAIRTNESTFGCNRSSTLTLKGSLTLLVERFGSRWRRRLATVAVIVAAVYATPASAQIGTGTLTGKVVDSSTKQPVADVVVTATSPALQGEQVVVTDSSGTFRIPNLPPGSYGLRYEGTGFHPFSRGSIEVRSSVTLRVDAELLPETLRAEEVEVVARAPVIDMGSARAGVTVTQEQLSRVPVAPPSGKGGAVRSFEQVADLAPSGKSDTYGSSVSGTTSPENQYTIDGASVGDPGFGYNGSPLSIDFIKEVNIVTGGFLPEYGRGGGGMLDVVTKSGSNEVHGSVWSNLTPFQANPKVPPPQEAISLVYKLDSVRDMGFDVGGPIVKDKLWFYGGFDIAYQTFKLKRGLHSLNVGADGKYALDGDGLITSQPIPDSERTWYAQSRSMQGILKFTYSPGPNDRIELTGRGTPSTSGGDGYYPISPETGIPYAAQGNMDRNLPTGTYGSSALKMKLEAYNATLKWTHSTDNKKLTFDTIAGWHHQRTAQLPVDGSAIGGTDGLAGKNQYIYTRTSPRHDIFEFENIGAANLGLCSNMIPMGDQRCPIGQYRTGGPGFLYDRNFERLQLRELMTYVFQWAGHHVVKAGAEFEYLIYDSTKAYSGGSQYRERTSGTQVDDVRRYGGLEGPDTQYTIKALRFNNKAMSVGAFAQDSWAIMDMVTLAAGLRYDTQSLYAEGGALGLRLPNQISPRIGAIFDPTQRGNAKIFANYARYYQSMVLDVMDRASSGEPMVRTRRSPTVCNPNAAGYSDPNPMVNPCENPANLIATGAPGQPDQTWYYGSTGRTTIDPNLKPMSSDEYSGGLEYQVLANSRLGLTGTYRKLNYAVEDMSLNEGTTYFIGNPGYGIATAFPKADRTYKAATLSFTKAFVDSWLAQASYTWSHLRGNFGGLFVSETGQLDPGITADFDLTSLLANRTGDLPGDRRHEVKLFVAKDIELAAAHRLNLGGSYIVRSGAPTNYLSAHILYGPDTGYLLPRGTGPRMPWVHETNIHVGYTFYQSKNQTVALTMDVFNILNLKAVTVQQQRYTLRQVRPIQDATCLGDPFEGGNMKNIKNGCIAPIDGEAGTPDANNDGVRDFQDSDKYKPFGAPLAYQQPITFRFGLKSTF